MFSQVFTFVLKCFGRVVSLFRNIYIEPGFSYFTFLICCSVALLLIQLLNMIRQEQEGDREWLRRVQRYDEQKVRDSLRIKEEKDSLKRRD